MDDQLQNCGGLGGGGLKALYWSPNNRYFYYTDWREGSPESCGNYIVPMIYRFDTLTGENSLVGGGHLSPDKTKLAMWDWPKNEIVIWDLDQGEIGRVVPLRPELARGGITWSLDSRSIRYIQTEFECAPDYGRTYIMQLDLRDYSQRLLAEYPGPDKKAAITPVPSGVFVLLLYPPLVMNYDPSVWKDESQYSDTLSMSTYFITNYLQALQLDSCKIRQQGPMGDIPAAPQVIQLGTVRYEVVTLRNSPDSVLVYYIENQSLTELNYDHGTAVLAVEASQAEWVECRKIAEEVLATLHVS